jgi:hypothetical protein
MALASLLELIFAETLGCYYPGTTRRALVTTSRADETSTFTLQVCCDDEADALPPELVDKFTF